MTVSTSEDESRMGPPHAKSTSEIAKPIWGPGEQRLHPVAVAKHGYEKARRIGMMAMVGGKDKTRIRNATPAPFRDLLISMARTAVSRPSDRRASA